MAKQVSIDSLSITNFGPFYGENRIDFTTEEDDPPHILIGGKNGVGKTHVLRALYLAVVGQVGASDLRSIEAGSEVTRFSFDNSLNRRASSEGEDTVKLSVILRQKDVYSKKERSLELHREIRFRAASPPRWTSSAKSSSDDRLEDDESAIERLRDTFLPRHLARFFFFDAEKAKISTSGIKRLLRESAVSLAYGPTSNWKKG